MKHEGPDIDGLCERIDALTVRVGNLIQTQSEQIHSQQYREWEYFIETAGDVASSSNAATLAFRPRAGWEWLVNRYTVTIGGASTGANVDVFVSGSDQADTATYSTLVDFEVGFYGSSPSRAVSDNNSPVYVPQSHYILFYVSATAAAGNFVHVRLEGRRRQM